MELDKGHRLGPYEISGLLGRGGMGAVYKATDTRLGRDVAIKVILAQHADKAEFRRRLEREARAVSKLSHPNICALHDVGAEDGVDYLVMEYVEGTPLDERLRSGPLKLAEALDVALDVAAALDAAHGQGLVHRDLKPANVMLTTSGAKLLDFGLAKAVRDDLPIGAEEPGASGDRTLTAAGTIVGTLQYMAPEQLENRSVDSRADLFAFGCILYEMVAGRRPFDGDSAAGVIAEILHGEPAPLDAGAVPSALRHTVGTCLEKDPEKRWRTAHDLGVQLRWIRQESASGLATAAPPAAAVPAAGAASVAAAKKARVLSLAAFAALAASVVLFAVSILSRDSETEASTPALVRFQVPLPPGTHTQLVDIRSHVAVSPDGARLALVAAGGDNVRRLYVRELSSLSTEALEGTEGAASPAFSADGRSLLYLVGDRIMRLDLATGPPREVGRGTHVGRSMTWLDDGSILVSRLRELVRIPKTGGDPETVHVDSEGGTASFLGPTAIRGAQRFSYSVMHPGRDEEDEVRIGSLDPDEADRTWRLAGIKRGFVHVLASGVVVHSAGGVLYARRFDPVTFEPIADPVVLAKGVQMFRTHAAEVAVTEDVLIYRRGRDVERMVWVDRDGRELGRLGGADDYGSFRLSPTEDRLAVTIHEHLDQTDLWIFDLERGVPTRFTSSAGLKSHPVWADDGLVFAGKVTGPPLLRLHRHGDSAATLLQTPMDPASFPHDVASDGRILFWQYRGYQLLSVDGGEPESMMASQHRLGQARLSPDKRWLAFAGADTGRYEVYLIHLDHPEVRKRVSLDGGRAPRWRGDGRELFFKAPDGRVMGVPVTLGDNADGTVIGTPAPLFAADPRRPGNYEVTSDGRRFLVLKVEKSDDEAPFTVVLGWQRLLAAR